MINKITEYYKEYINDELDEMIFKTGIEILLFDMFTVSLILIVGFLFRQFTSSIIFIFVFSNLRKHSGGYHANTHFQCILFSILTFILFIFITDHQTHSDANKE